jgi:hypothetical protein
MGADILFDCEPQAAAPGGEGAALPSLARIR